MTLSENDFIKGFSKEALDGRASLFLGAGASVDAGYPSWGKLFEPCGERLGLYGETDNLYMLAQYYANRYGEVELRRIINDSLNGVRRDSPLVDSLLDVGFDGIWTTNFDKVLEENLSRRGIRHNVIFSERDLKNVNLHGATNVFKMNGDITHIDEVVATQNDFEEYEARHGLLKLFLKRELVTSTFLFVGYSFTDNLVLSCLSSLRSYLGREMPAHYAIFPKRDDDPAFPYYVEDLGKRYGIRSIILECECIPDFVGKIAEEIRRSSVFVSGSLSDGPTEYSVEADRFAERLASKLVEHGFRIHSCLGKRFGTYLAGHAFARLQERGFANAGKHLVLSPFPFHGNTTAEERRGHRARAIEPCFAAVFAYGRLRDDHPKTPCGVFEEYCIARDMGKVVIPVGSTGVGAKMALDDAREELTRHPYLEKRIEALGQQDDPEELSELVVGILDEARKQPLSL